MEIYKEDIGFTGTKEELVAIISQYKADIDEWTKSEGIPKPIPDHSVYDNLLKVDDFLLKSKEQEEVDRLKKEEVDKLNQEAYEQTKKEHAAIAHTNKCNKDHENYDYEYARSNANDGYLQLGEQLDMQYWDLVNNTTTWKDHIQAVKNRYPKTS